MNMSDYGVKIGIKADTGIMLLKPSTVSAVVNDTRGEHAIHYATDAVPYFYLIFINVFNQNFLLSFNILFENKN
jgi:hypothetical protein